MISLFFFKDTEPTELYTYLHTLALHYALPISDRFSGLPAGHRRDDRHHTAHRLAHPLCLAGARHRQARPPEADSRRPARPRRHRRGPDRRRIGYLPRSEEHTSELQSLMRISYAVFCLKNKTYSLLPSQYINLCNLNNQHATTMH